MPVNPMTDFGFTKDGHGKRRGGIKFALVTHVCISQNYVVMTLLASSVSTYTVQPSGMRVGDMGKHFFWSLLFFPYALVE